MPKYTRRDAVRTMLAGTLGASAMSSATLAGAPADEPPPFQGKHQPKPLPFNPAKLNGISEKLIRSHWENNYTGAVNALNEIEKRLGTMRNDKDLPGFIYGDLKREELLRTGSVVLHELYFANLGGDGKPGGGIAQAIAKSFGTIEAWEAEFRKTAAALAGGSGWVTLGYNLHTGELHNYWAWDHAHNPPFTVPLLVLDMYEHAYHMDYGSAAAKYVTAFFQNINWETVDRRAQAVFKTERK